MTFGITCAIGALACMALPYDTTGRVLDGHEDEEGEDQEKWEIE